MSIPVFSKKPIIGMVHLPPLPGAPRFSLSLNEITKVAVAEATCLVKGGVHGIMVENFGDAPFASGRVEAVTVAAMSSVIAAIRQAIPDTPLGVNVLRNDGLSALSIAVATGAQFIRVNILSGARLTDQGLIESNAYELLRLRGALHANQIEILADVDVKHSYPLAPVSLDQEVSDLYERSLAYATVVSGSGTGGAVDIGKLKKVKEKAGSRLVLLGSGVTEMSMGQLLAIADGAIVGTAFKRDGKVLNPIDPKRVESFMAEYHRMKS